MMVSPLPFLSHVAASRNHPPRVLCLAPTRRRSISSTGAIPPITISLSLYCFPSLVEAGRRVEVCGMRNLLRLASCLIQAKEDARS